MTIAVRYFSRTGNTKKLADAIAEAVCVKAFDLSIPLTEDVDILFLGSSVYAAGIDNSVKTFIAGIPVSIGKVVNFSTAALLPSTYTQVKNLVESNGIKMCEKEFHCRGSFQFMHKSKPNTDDFNAAKIFAKQIISHN